MERYLDQDGDTNVSGFEVGEGYIDVQFKSGSVYRYTTSSAGALYVDNMIHFARRGEGLNAFITSFVRDKYAEKLC